MPETPQPPAPDTDPHLNYGERTRWFERFRQFTERPLGRLTTALAVTVALSQVAAERHADSHITTSANIVTEASDKIDLELADGTTIHLTDWENPNALTTQSHQEAIEPNETLQKFATTNNPVTDEIGLSPPQIENTLGFTTWVAGQAGRDDLLEKLGINDDTSRTPRQLVDLAASIVMSNIDYQHDTSGESNYDLPMDQNLMHGRDMQCEGYASATLAVFGALKVLYPKELQNTYMTTQSGLNEGHVWNLIMQIESPSRASMAFIDATADDPSYSQTEPAVELGFIELIEGLFEKRIINADTFYALAAQYDAKQGFTPEEREELASDMMYVLGRLK